MHTLPPCPEPRLPVMPTPTRAPGTRSCIVMPDSNLHGVLRKKPFSTLVGLVGNPLFAKTRRLPITLTIGGHRFDIPFDEWCARIPRPPLLLLPPESPLPQTLLPRTPPLFDRLVTHDPAHPPSFSVTAGGSRPRTDHASRVPPTPSWASYSATCFFAPSSYSLTSRTPPCQVDPTP